MSKSAMPFFSDPHQEFILSVYDNLISEITGGSFSNATGISFSYSIDGSRFYENHVSINILNYKREFYNILSDKLSQKLNHLKINFFDESDVKLGHFDFIKNSFFFIKQQARPGSTI